MANPQTPHSPQENTAPDTPAAADRRKLLRNWLRGMIAIGGALFLYPLVRFASFQTPRKPRLVEVPAPLPLSGVHSGQDFLLFVKDGEAWAVSRTCTHLGCRIGYLEDKGLIECPCHQSRFTPEGRRIAGPAEKDLPRYTVLRNRAADGSVRSYTVEM